MWEKNISHFYWLATYFCFIIAVTGCFITIEIDSKNRSIIKNNKIKKKLCVNQSCNVTGHDGIIKK